MRPIYERPNDRTRQGEIIRVLTAATGLRAEPTVPLVGWDFTLFRPDNTVSALVEVKARNHERLRYPTYIISRAKIDALAEDAERNGCTGGLLVGWQDETGWVRVNHPIRQTWNVIRGGRRDRNDPADIEPMYEIPHESFLILPCAPAQRGV